MLNNPIALAVLGGVLFCAGCGKPNYYPHPESTCIEARKVREQMKTVSGGDRALLEAKAQGLEDACRQGMHEQADKQSRNKAPLFP